MSKRSALVLVALVVAGACGRSQSLLRSVEPQPEPDSTSGLRYYMPRDVIHVEGVATYSTGRGWFMPAKETDSAYCEAGESKLHLKTVEYTLTQSTVADRRVAYHLTMDHRGSADQTFKLGVTNDGLLSNMNYTSTDKTAEVVGNVLKGLAGIAGTALGVGALGVSKNTMFLEKTPLPVTVRDRGEWCAAKARATIVVPLLLERGELEKELAKALAARRVALAAVDVVKRQPQIKYVADLDDLHARRIAVIDARLNSVRDAIAANVAQFKAEKQITGPDTIIRADGMFDITDLPKDSALVGHLSSFADAKTALANLPKASKLLSSTRLIVSIAEEDAAGKQAKPNGPKRRTPGDCEPTEKSADNCLHVYSRIPHARLVRIYVPDGSVDSKPFFIKETRLLNIVSSADPIIDVPISARSLGQETFALTFGRSGTLTGFEQTSTSGLAAATSSFASALSNARQEFVAGLQSVQTSQTSYDAIKSEARASRIKDLQDQKSLIDAQVALQGANVNQSLALQKQQVDAELALLTAQQNLVAAQATATVGADVAALKAQLAQVQAQLDLLKAQLELEKTKKAANPN